MQNTVEMAQSRLRERTLVMIKPDAFLRGLTAEIMLRLERLGLRLVAMKTVQPTEEQIIGHFPKDPAWVATMGQKTLDSYKDHGIDPIEILGTSDSTQIGEMIRDWNYHYLRLGPVVVIVYEGVRAIPAVRKVIGNTLPYKAEPGTIRGDYSINTPELANIVGSACKNLIHASGNAEEAEQEIANWFKPQELMDYTRLDTYLSYLAGQNYPHQDLNTSRLAALESQSHGR